MLYIQDGEKEHVWHIGSPLPQIQGRVVKFQADGDELTALILGLDSEYTSPIPGRRIDAPGRAWVKAIRAGFGLK